MHSVNEDAVVAFALGDVLVADRTDPDWTPVLRKASAVVTRSGGRTCHAAIIARELGIPAVIGCGAAANSLHTGQTVTVSCAEGDVGVVYDGTIPFTRTDRDTHAMREAWARGIRHTQLHVTLSDPHRALALAALPVTGVGLVRLEFSIASMIQVHPMALIQFQSIQDPALRAQIHALTPSYGANDKGSFFLNQLTQSIGLMAAAFYPRPVIVRFSDFKTNEYRGLLGGALFEPPEENPMIGWRGASRYYDPAYAPAFALECQAIKRVRDQFGLTNVITMIPFCRSPEEGRFVLAQMALAGLERGLNGLEVYIMCEIPSNVLLAAEFCALFDGMSIGSNDLTQLLLGVDRDSERLHKIFDEESPAVKNMISSVILSCHAAGRKIGLCGQAPSEKPDYAAWLIEQNIDSISLNPGDVFKIMAHVQQMQLQQRQPAPRSHEPVAGASAVVDAKKQSDDKSASQFPDVDETHKKEFSVREH